MKKVINGKVYNTDTAMRLAYMDNGQNYGDFRYYEAEIYRTKKGALFLYESGGAYSTMSVPVGNNGSGGSSDIRTITTTEAVDLVNEWSQDRYIDSADTTHALEALGCPVIEA